MGPTSSSGPVSFVFEGLHDAEGPDLGVVGEFLRELDGRGGSAGGVEGLHPLGGGLREEDFADLFADAVDDGVVGWVEGVELGIRGGVVIDTEDPANLIAVGGGESAENDGAVFRLVAAIVEAEGSAEEAEGVATFGEDVGVGTAVGAAIGDGLLHGCSDDGIDDGEAGDDGGLHREGGAEEGGADVLALAGGRCAGRVRHRCPWHRRARRRSRQAQWQ